MGQAQNICACPIFTMLHLLHTKHTQPIITLKVCKCTPQTIFGLNSGELQTPSLFVPSNGVYWKSMGYVKRCKTKKWYLRPLPYYNNLHAEHLTSYTNTLQLIGYQYFNQCKMLQIPLTRNLHNLHAATRHKHGRRILRHRGTEKSVAPTEFSMPLWRIIYWIRPCWLRGSEVRCVRCMQGCVRYFETILHSWNLCISTCYTQKV